jgi:hypothetical protein
MCGQIKEQKDAETGCQKTNQGTEISSGRENQQIQECKVTNRGIQSE